MTLISVRVWKSFLHIELDSKYFGFASSRDQMSLKQRTYSSCDKKSVTSFGWPNLSSEVLRSHFFCLFLDKPAKFVNSVKFAVFVYQPCVVLHTICIKSVSNKQ